MITKSVGVFILTMIMAAMLVAGRDGFDPTHAEMPFTRGWYRAFFIFAVIVALGCWLVLK